MPLYWARFERRGANLFGLDTRDYPGTYTKVAMLRAVEAVQGVLKLAEGL